MKMGKSKGSKKWSNHVRKENRPYNSGKTIAQPQLQPGPSQPKRSERCLMDDSSEEEGGEGVASGLVDHLPLSSRPSWNMLNSNNITSDEFGIVPLPPEEKNYVMEMGVSLRSAPIMKQDAKVLPSTVGVRPFFGSKQSLVTPAQGAKPSTTVPLAPRVLGNSQRENRPQNSADEDPATSFLGLLTPPRRRDLRHHSPSHEGPDYFENVPDEVLLHIFYFLTRRNLVRCMRVCKKWNRVGYDELLWRRVDISHRKIHSQAIWQIFNRGSTHLRLAKTEISEDAMEQLGFYNSFTEEPSMSRLQYLDLSMAAISENTLSDVLSHCRQLRKVSLEHVTVNDTILHLLSENPKLDTLNMAMCRGVTSSGLMPLFAHCSQLTQLNLAWSSMDSRCISYVCGAVPDSVQHLNISGCREAISDDDVERLSKRCKSLLELDLSDSLRLTETTIYTIAQNLQNLQNLSLNRCYHVLPSMLGELGQMPNLRMLNVIGMLDREDLDHLRQKLPNIQINAMLLSTVARPTTGQRRTSIWEQRVREEP